MPPRRATLIAASQRQPGRTNASASNVEDMSRSPQALMTPGRPKGGARSSRTTTQRCSANSSASRKCSHSSRTQGCAPRSNSLSSHDAAESLGDKAAQPHTTRWRSLRRAASSRKGLRFSDDVDCVSPFVGSPSLSLSSPSSDRGEGSGVASSSHCVVAPSKWRAARLLMLSSASGAAASTARAFAANLATPWLLHLCSMRQPQRSAWRSASTTRGAQLSRDAAPGSAPNNWPQANVARS
mmetsp:Transcript_2027/g.5643  ORF Transcript_2027/g.5643 Transcript_2027/m.5643 type:complete len:240 (+) Transcript_2027:2703-3422(+)